MEDTLLVAAAVALVIAPAIARYRLRRDALVPLSALVDGIEAVGVAAMGVTVAATSASPAAIAGGAMIAFAAIVQQYAALVFAHLAKRREALVGAPLDCAAMLGVIAYVLLGSPPLVLVAIGCWCMVECAWTSIVRGLAIDDPVRPPVLPPLAGRARWRRLGEGLAASRDVAFWGLVVARPIARVLLQLVAEQRWITPNRITIASIACCFAAALAIIEGAIVAALVLVGIRSVLDSLDGQLARYRACGTNLGSYVDKVSDLFCWGALYAALAIQAYATTQALAMLVLPLVAAIVLALQGFALWLARALVPDASATTSPPAGLGVVAWLAAWPRIARFEEPDFYLWIALAIATARYDLFVPLIAGAHVVRALVLGIARSGLATSIGKPGTRSPA